MMKTATMFWVCIINIVKESFMFQKDLLAVLVIFILVDCVTEIMLMLSKKKIKFRIYNEWIMRKCAVLLVVLLASIMDLYILRTGTLVSTATMLFYLSYEGIAILKNVSKMGVPFPKALKTALEQMKDGKN